MKKNSQIHLMLETELFEKLKKQAFENNISMSEMYRQKLRENSQLNRIEEMLRKLLQRDYEKKNGKTL